VSDDNGNTPQQRGLVDASSMFFARGVSIGRTVDADNNESALLVVSGNFGGDDEFITLHIAIELDSWPTFLDMLNRFDEVGQPPTPGDAV
jgi:hypothetical protein